MALDTSNIWKKYGDEFYFFILKKVKKEEIAKEVLQNSFFKIHGNLAKLKEDSKVRAWAYQIVRNEIADFYYSETNVSKEVNSEMEPMDYGIADTYCCFDKFLQKLPDKYFSVIEQVYLKGNSQQQAAEHLNISLANAKARVRRAKELLKKDFQKCCKYEVDSKGLLVGEPDCSSCDAGQ